MCSLMLLCTRLIHVQNISYVPLRTHSASNEKRELRSAGISSAALALTDGSSKQPRIIVVCQQGKRQCESGLVPLIGRADYFTVTEHHLKLRKRRLTPDYVWEITIITLHASLPKCASYAHSALPLAKEERLNRRVGFTHQASKVERSCGSRYDTRAIQQISSRA